ncbi:MAG: hypothetical protein RSE15_00650 [Flavobacterium sp.]|uniref:hypothetical protein n=1 Tax=Flavobacterium sp. TaxID=239 RepID=UPI002B4651B0|nr:hypothetical protein [Flavobacterium sp.]WRH73356.1 MAG: hypothetical protein RSE15_00650 [Flavobacterium sp.]
MINKTRRRKLKKVLKHSFIADVLKKLNDDNVFNKKGEPFSKMYISLVFNGKNENIDIELAIMEVYNLRLEQQKMYVEKRKQLEK